MLPSPLPRRRLPRLAAVVLAAGLLWAVAPAGAALAEIPAGSARSRIDSVDPAGAVQAEVVAGDEYLQLTVAPGHEVVVLGYGGEPFLRFRADGTVEANTNAETTAASQDRYDIGGAAAPAPADAPPAWSPVGEGGTYRWHDHRIHWMVQGPLPVGPGEQVFAWKVPLQVDGAAGEVRGGLVHAGEAPGAWPVVVAVAVALVLLGLGVRRPRRWCAVAVSVLALACVVACIGERAALGSVVDGGPLTLVPPLLVTGSAVVALVGLRRDRGWVPGAAACGVVLSSSWLLTRVAVLVEPVVVSAWSTTVARVLVAVAWGAAGAALLLAGEAWRRTAGARSASTRPAASGQPVRHPT